MNRVKNYTTKAKKKQNNISCKDYALFLVSLRAQSIGQLREKLEKKKYPAEEIDAAIERLAELNYLNDQQFAQIFFENLKKYKNFGYFGIKKKLIEKKLPKKDVGALLKTFTLKEEAEIAKRLMEKNKNKSREQLVRAMQSKGFRGDVVFKVTKISIEE